MGFAAPLALLGLISIAVPIVIHLLRTRDVPVRTLPTVSMLERALAHSRQRRRIQDHWLLLLRVLGLMALGLAVAEPFIVSSRPFDDDRLASLVIVLDDSMSMGRIDGGARLIDTAVDEAVDAIRGLPRGSEVALVLAGAPARLAVPSSADPERVVRALRALPERLGRGTDVPGAIALARRSLATAKHARRVWVVSDFAVHSGVADARFPNEGVSVALQRVGEDAEDNLAVLRTSAAPDPTRNGEISVRATLRGPPALERRVVVEREGDVLASTDVRFDERGHAEVTLHVPPDDDPAATVAIVDADDALPEDDRRGVLLRAPRAIEVLLVDGDPHPTRTRDEVGFLSRALDVAPREPAIRYRVVDAGSVTPVAIEGIDVVVLANVKQPSVPIARALQRFVEEGGGLWIASGDQVDHRVYRQRLAALLPGVLGPTVDLEGARLEPSPDALERARVQRVSAFEPAVDADVRTRAGGAPLRVDRVVGAGRVSVWTSTLDDAWNDLPYHPGFVPLVLDGIAELGHDAPPPPSVETGTPLDVGDASVRTPEGHRVDAVDGVFADTTTPGVYRVLDDDGAVRFAVVVAPPSNESELAEAPLPEINGDARSSGGVVASRRPLAPWLFLLLGLLALAEGALRLRGFGRVARSGTG